MLRLQFTYIYAMAYHTEGGGWGINPPLEDPKALRNRAKLNQIRKLLKIAELRTPTSQDVREKRQ